MTPPFDLVLFDLDGTLVETAPEICDATNDTLREFGWPEVDEAQVARWIGHGTGELLVQAVAQASSRPAAELRGSDELAAIGTAYDRHYGQRCGSRSRLYPQVTPVLDHLRSLGVKLAVVTNKETRYTVRVLHAHALASRFDRVLCGDTLATRKPDPTGVLDCLSAFNVAPARSLFVGDSSIDVATARRAGVAVWLLPYGYNMGEPVQRAAPDRVIEHFGQLLDAFAAPHPSTT